MGYGEANANVLTTRHMQTPSELPNKLAIATKYAPYEGAVSTHKIAPPASQLLATAVAL